MRGVARAWALRRLARLVIRGCGVEMVARELSGRDTGLRIGTVGRVVNGSSDAVRTVLVQ